MLRAISYSSLAIAAAAVSAVALAAEGDSAKDAIAHAVKPATAGERQKPSHSRAAARDRDGEGIDVSQLRIREGTQLRDVPGRFRERGESLIFIDDQNREINGLPNLNLERVLRMLKTVEEPESIAWTVSGMITEFEGENYLLISRAVYKSAAPPPLPETLSN
jgi:hypothetical protein